MSQETSSLPPTPQEQGQTESQQAKTALAQSESQLDTASQAQADHTETSQADTTLTEPTALSESAEQASYRFGHIRSFVHRRAHITPGQQEAINTLMQDWAINYAPEHLDFEQTFGRQAPTILEIGFGMGETTEKIAQLRHDENFLGVEVFNAGVGAMLKRIHNSGLKNVRIIQHDAVEVVTHMLPEESLDGVHIYFPDPWPKKRHHKRRLIQGPFIKLLASRLKPGGYIHCATDWENYAEQMLEVLSAEPSLQNTAEGYAPKPAYRPQTKFETRGFRLGHDSWDLVFTKR